MSPSSSSRPTRLGDEVAGRRLLHEAHAAAVSRSPVHLHRLRNRRTPEGQAFIVMQYVEGEPLSTLLQAGPMPVRDALALRRQHRRGARRRTQTQHRPSRPEAVQRDGHAVGAPEAAGLRHRQAGRVAATAVNAPTSSVDVTTAGTIVGTPAYMSPEQIQQRPLDGRSDLFSLGVVLFESLTGRRAFEGPSRSRRSPTSCTCTRRRRRRYGRELTDRHDELCRRLMAKDASDRFQSAEEVVGAIRLLLPDTSRTVVSSGDLRRRPTAWAAGVAPGADCGRRRGRRRGRWLHDLEATSAAAARAARGRRLVSARD